MKNNSEHTFHIPVMGLGYTIDTPMKVARFGISSVVSIIEDHLIEKMREIICKKESIQYNPISVEDIDHRAKRVTAYLNLLDNIVASQIEEIKEENFESGAYINQYFQMLPDNSATKALYTKMITSPPALKNQLQTKLRQLIIPGSIDVNIMTKLDKANYDENGNELPMEYSDAIAAFRGYANSNLKSSIIFSAGINPRLFGYCENFKDFFPDANGNIKKNIILKVSDYRSAIIQGKYLAKKGLWVSEFRVESGINCGGHTFISNGIPLGPILEEFKNRRTDLFDELYSECITALNQLGRNSFFKNPELKITAQGGIGTSAENNLLLDYYQLNATGWGSPFLLVPEATNVDKQTLQQLITAKKEDYYLSHASPLGIPFNNFRNSSSEKQRHERINKNRPGSPCYKKFLSSDKEFTVKPICTASREYQNLKIKQVQSSYSDPLILEKEIEKITVKDCLCEGLGASALIRNGAELSHNLSAVTICPGPNLAYFSGQFSLKEMVDHIYGRLNILNNLSRPLLFINELELYFDYLKKEIDDQLTSLTDKKISYFENFRSNLLSGINYYESLIPKIKVLNEEFKTNTILQLAQLKESINQLAFNKNMSASI